MADQNKYIFGGAVLGCLGGLLYSAPAKKQKFTHTHATKLVLCTITGAALGSLVKSASSEQPAPSMPSTGHIPMKSRHWLTPPELQNRIGDGLAPWTPWGEGLGRRMGNSYSLSDLQNRRLRESARDANFEDDLDDYEDYEDLGESDESADSAGLESTNSASAITAYSRFKKLGISATIPEEYPELADDVQVIYLKTPPSLEIDSIASTSARAASEYVYRAVISGKTALFFSPVSLDPVMAKITTGLNLKDLTRFGS